MTKQNKMDNIMDFLPQETQNRKAFIFITKYVCRREVHIIISIKK